MNAIEEGAGNRPLDYTADDIEDRFDLYRQADGVTTLDRGLARLFDEQPMQYSPPWWAQ